MFFFFYILLSMFMSLSTMCPCFTAHTPFSFLIFPAPPCDSCFFWLFPCSTQAHRQQEDNKNNNNKHARLYKCTSLDIPHRRQQTVACSRASSSAERHIQTPPPPQIPPAQVSLLPVSCIGPIIGSNQSCRSSRVVRLALNREQRKEKKIRGGGPPPLDTHGCVCSFQTDLILLFLITRPTCPPPSNKQH